MIKLSQRDTGSNPARCSNSLQPFLFVWLQARQWTGTWALYLVLCMFFSLLKFASGNLLLTKINSLHGLWWTSDFHWIGALGVGLWALTCRHVLARIMCCDFSFCTASQLFDWPVISWFIERKWKKRGPCKRNFRCSSPTLTIWACKSAHLRTRPPTILLQRCTFTMTLNNEQ